MIAHDDRRVALDLAAIGGEIDDLDGKCAPSAFAKARRHPGYLPLNPASFRFDGQFRGYSHYCASRWKKGATTQR
jgi:hypothetical protein